MKQENEVNKCKTN